MTIRPLHSILAVTLAALLLNAQEKPTPAGKPGPEQRPPGVAFPDTLRKPSTSDGATRTSQSLPKFDLPDYVITGAATLDLPENEKLEPNDPSYTLTLADPAAMPRDRLTVDFRSEAKDRAPIIDGGEASAMLRLSSGTFFTSRVGFWYSQQGEDHFFTGSAQYAVSKAYEPYANRSRGVLDLSGGTILKSPGDWYDRGTMSASLGYENGTYRFYGSGIPGLTRSVSLIRLGAGYASARDLLFSYDAGVGLSLNNISDSTTTVTETLFGARTKTNLAVGQLPIDGRLEVSVASVSGTASQSLPALMASLEAGRVWFGDFSLQGSVHFYLAQGMLGQRLARVYPHVSLGYRTSRSNTVSLTSTGQVHRNTLTSLGLVQPYLASYSTIRQSDAPLDLTAAVETDWTDSWRTRVSARVQSVHDYPFFVEGGTRGVWTADYRGTTRVTTYQGELFAKFNANSYFTLSAEANSSKNSLTQGKVPYLPDFRLSGGAWIEFRHGLVVFPTLAYVDKRVSDLIGVVRLKGYFTAGVRAEYSIARFFNLIVECQNLTNDRYEEWRGYRTVPFTITAGLSYRW